MSFLLHPFVVVAGGLSAPRGTSAALFFAPRFGSKPFTGFAVPNPRDHSGLVRVARF